MCSEPGTEGFVTGGLGVRILPELAGGIPGIELRTVRGQKPIRRAYRDERDLRLVA